MKNEKSLFLIVGFFVLLFLPHLFLLNENKEAKFPSFKFHSISTSIAEFDVYYKEKFGGKYFFMKLHNNLHYHILKSSPFYNSTIIGTNGWLFNNQDGALYENMGLYKFNENQLDTIWRNIKGRKERLDQQGIKYYVCIAPNKHAVYGKFLPLYFQNKGETKLEQVKSYLLKKQFELIDLKDNFSNYDTLRLFHKTDTHWNTIGAFLGYKRLMQSIQKDFNHITTFELSDFKMDTLIKSVATGDLTHMIKVEEEYLSLQSKREYKAVELEKKVKQPYYYEYRYKGTGNLKVVIFRDSFCIDMIPFLREYFGETVFIWHQDFNEQIIKEEKPDIVIHEIVERNIDELIIK